MHVTADKEVATPLAYYGIVTCLLVLGKFGLVWFGPFFPKPETKLFGFSQNF